MGRQKENKEFPWRRVEVNLGLLEKIYIIPISDIHIGDPRCNLEKLHRYLDWIEENNAYIILNGDLMTADIKNSVGNVYEAELNPQEQLDSLVKIFKPFSDRILGITSGNHEQRIYKETGIDVIKVFADSIGREAYYHPDAVDIFVRFGKNSHGKPVTYHIFMTHGWAGGRKTGSKMNAIEEVPNIFPLADCYVVSHTHTQAVTTNIVYYPDDRNKGYIELKRLFVSSGSFLGYGGYVMRKALPVAKLGSPRLRLDGKRKDIHVSL